MQAKLVLVGNAPLIMHNERLADPLDPIVREISKYSKKRGKTDEDHREIGRLEFLGGIYSSIPLDYPLDKAAIEQAVPVLPAWNIIRSLQDGGKRHKQGANVVRGIFPIPAYAEVEYQGPTNIVDLWDDGGFALRKSVGVQKSRTMRTRPIFPDWKVTLPVDIDDTVFNVDQVRQLLEEAGKYAGIGDMRPVYGRYTGTVEVA